MFNPPGFKDYIDLPLDELDYRDTSIVAFPVEPRKSPMMSEELLKQLPAKANRKDASNFIKARDLMDPTLIDWSDNEGANAVPLSQVMDL